MLIDAETGAGENVSTSAIDVANPCMDPRRFRDVMGKFTTGVTVVSYLKKARAAGLTANGVHVRIARSAAGPGVDPQHVAFGFRAQARAMP
jgi:flavin reductase (DIM6/NTAB) family NADH-FMN oxidoreductase RutF